MNCQASAAVTCWGPNSCLLHCRLELLEAAGCSTLSCTLAWHRRNRSSNGFCSLAAAVDDALEALRAVAPPQPRGTPAFQVQSLHA